jgi:hypothetical protein
MVGINWADIFYFYSLSAILLCSLGYAFLRLLRKIVGDRYFSLFSSAFRLRENPIHAFNFLVLIGISFILLISQVSINGAVFAFSSYVILAISILSVIFLLKDHRHQLIGMIKREGNISLLLFLLFLFVIVFHSGFLINGQPTSIGDAIQHSIAISKVETDGLYFPQISLHSGDSYGSYAIAATLAFLLKVPMSQAAILMTGFLSTLIFTAFYSVGVMLKLRNGYSFLIAVMGSLLLQSSFTFISWGGLPYGFGLYLLISSLALSLAMITSKIGHEKKFVLLVPILFGPILAVYPRQVVLLIPWLLICTLANFSNNGILKKVKRFSLLIIGLSVAFLLFSSYTVTPLYTRGLAVANRPPLSQTELNAGSWIYNFNDQFSPLAFLNVAGFQKYLNLSLFTPSTDIVFALVPFGVLAAFAVIIFYKTLKKENSNDSFLNISLTISFCYIMMIVVWGLINAQKAISQSSLLTGNFALQVFSLVVDPQRMLDSEGVFILLIQALSVVLFSEFLISLIHKREKIVLTLKNRTRNVNTSKIVAGSIIFFFLIANVGAVLNETAYAKTWINDNTIWTASDQDLQSWMTNHLPSNSSILIQWSDAGRYLPLTTNFKIIYPYGFPPSYQLDSEYNQILNDLSNWPDNPEVIKHLNNLNVSYVYLDSSPWPKSSEIYINPTSLIKSLHYDLVKTMGNAYLFKVNYFIPFEFKEINMTNYDKPEYWSVSRGTAIISIKYSGGVNNGQSFCFEGKNDEKNALQIVYTLPETIDLTNKTLTLFLKANVTSTNDGLGIFLIDSNNIYSGYNFQYPNTDQWIKYELKPDQYSWKNDGFAQINIKFISIRIITTGTANITLWVDSLSASGWESIKP